jgi:hypothetical protein
MKERRESLKKSGARRKVNDGLYRGNSNRGMRDHLLHWSRDAARDRHLYQVVDGYLAPVRPMIAAAALVWWLLFLVAWADLMLNVED